MHRAARKWSDTSSPLRRDSGGEGGAHRVSDGRVRWGGDGMRLPVSNHYRRLALDMGANTKRARITDQRKCSQPIRKYRLSVIMLKLSITGPERSGPFFRTFMLTLSNRRDVMSA